MDDSEDHYNEMMNEEAVDDLCPMTDSSPADNVVNVNSRSSTRQQMVTGEMTVRTMKNNNYSSNINGGFADRLVIHSYIDPRPVVVDQINQSMIDSRPVVVDGKHARQASRAVQGQTHKTKGKGSVTDLTDVKVKSVKHYHYLKPEATMDSITLLKRKAETMSTIISSLEELDDVENAMIYKRKHLQINILILKELDKQDAKVNQSQQLNS